MNEPNKRRHPRIKHAARIRVLTPPGVPVIVRGCCRFENPP
ncbi:hypothetical protein [methane-oxidizing endosymbiont of Gigantopelta aegis]|nr:hypothetical protein [methane-oxidizing endosymbiont of Gigantopelta aegis]